MVADGVTPFALSALKYGLFALLFLFIWRSMRWVVRGLTVEPTPRAGRGGRGTKGQTNAPPAPPGPTSLVVYADGTKLRVGTTVLELRR